MRRYRPPLRRTERVSQTAGSGAGFLLLPLRRSTAAKGFQPDGHRLEDVFRLPTRPFYKCAGIGEFDLVVSKLFFVKETDFSVSHAHHIKVEVNHGHRIRRPNQVGGDVDIQLKFTEFGKPRQPSLISRDEQKSAVDILKEQFLSAIDGCWYANGNPVSEIVLSQDPSCVPVMRDIRPLQLMDRDLSHPNIFAGFAGGSWVAPVPDRRDGGATGKRPRTGDRRLGSL
jgi:hypothetical protein